MFNLSNKQFNLPKPTIGGGNGNILKQPGITTLPKKIKPNAPKTNPFTPMPRVRPNNGATGFGNSLKPL